MLSFKFETVGHLELTKDKRAILGFGYSPRRWHGCIAQDIHPVPIDIQGRSSMSGMLNGRETAVVQIQ